MNCGCHSHNGFVLEKGSEGPAEQLSLEGLVPRGVREYLDSTCSVSGLELERDLYEVTTEKQLEEQSERFRNGS